MLKCKEKKEINFYIFILSICKILVIKYKYKYIKIPNEFFQKWINEYFFHSIRWILLISKKIKIFYITIIVNKFSEWMTWKKKGIVTSKGEKIAM